MDMDVFARMDHAGRMADGHAVLDDVFAFADVAERVLVSVIADFDIVEGMDDHGRSGTLKR